MRTFNVYYDRPLGFTGECYISQDKIYCRFLHGMLHCIDGPAEYTGKHDGGWYYLFGRQYSLLEWMAHPLVLGNKLQRILVDNDTV